MQIEIDFQVFKALTALRESETDSYNSVIQRLLKLPLSPQIPKDLREFDPVKFQTELSESLTHSSGAMLGVWYQNRHFPEGTKFRASYKGRTYRAEIKDGVWVGEDGVIRRSPSDAASAVSGTNVNGWRFWHAQIPPSNDWYRLDGLR